jgi:hypothetical protein
MTNEQPDGAPQEPTWHLQSPPAGQTPMPQVIAQADPTSHPALDPTANLASIDAGVPPAAAAVPGATSGRRTYLMTAGLIGAGVLAGVAAVTGVQSLRSTPAAQTTQAGQAQAGQSGQLKGGPAGGQQGGQQGGQLQGGQPGRMDGEQRVLGTVTAKTDSSITVALTSGSVTVQVGDQTEIVNNGARATLAQVAVGSKVFMHTYPLNGTTVAERIFVGTVPQGGPGGGPDDGQGDGQGNGQLSGQPNGQVGGTTGQTTASTGSTI